MLGVKQLKEKCSFRACNLSFPHIHFVCLSLENKDNYRRGLHIFILL